MKKPLFVILFLAVSAFGALQVSKARTFQVFGEIVARVETDQRVVALTFDDGPTPEFTEAILAILHQYDVPATFFLTGREITAHPEGARAIVLAGHEIGNHSFTHQRMVLVSPDFARAEITKTDQAIRAAGYAGEILFRPPYGKKLLVLPWVLAQQHRRTIMWGIEPESTLETPLTAQAIAENVLENAQNGSIILLHLMYASRQASRHALPLIIEGLRADGYGFVTTSELLVLGR